MAERYIPKVNQAAIPEDGGWAELREGPVLVLSIPEWEAEIAAGLMPKQAVWLYDRANDAYLFCFRLSDEKDYAIAFVREHAGVLLQNDRARAPFTLLVTAKELAETEGAPYLLMRNIELKRHPQAGW